jgi:hypothetical protein
MREKLLKVTSKSKVIKRQVILNTRPSGGEISKTMSSN